MNLLKENQINDINSTRQQKYSRTSNSNFKI